MAEPVTGAWIAGITEEVLLTHQPTGVMAKGTSRGEALAKLATVLIGRGDLTINDARAAMGLPPFDPPIETGRPEPRRFQFHMGGPCPSPQDDGTCGCEPAERPGG